MAVLAILWLAFVLLAIADTLAVWLGQAYGMMILTLAVFGIEVSMSGTVSLTGKRVQTKGPRCCLASIGRPSLPAI